MQDNTNEIIRALNYIDPHDRDTWIRMGTGIKTELGEEGFYIWDTWSATAENYSTNSARSTWKSLKPGIININSVFYEARQKGYTPKPYQAPDEQARLKIQRQREEAAKEAEALRQKEAQQAKEKAQSLWDRAIAANPNHPYLLKKGISSEQINNIKQLNKNLLIPLRQDKELVSLQFIDESGRKTFLPGGTVKGSAMIIGDTSNMKQEGYLIAEGFATAATLNKATNKPVVVAFNAGNLIHVSETLSKSLPNTPALICADNDLNLTGITKAEQALEVLKEQQSHLVIPEFSEGSIRQFKSIHGENSHPTDFNDLQELEGINEVKKQLDTLNHILERKSECANWNVFPEVIRNDNLGTLKQHPEYTKAKAGNPESAQDLVEQSFNNKTIEELKSLLAPYQKLSIVPVIAKEATGNNQIPRAMAEYLGSTLNIPVNQSIMQINKVSRTGKGIDHRFAFQSIFDGKVNSGQHYLLVDDSLSVGGTIASLRGYIENRGGNVVGAAVMTAHEKSVNIVPEKNMVELIINKHGLVVQDYWKKEFGYGIEKLTQAESKQLERGYKNVDEIRDRITQARSSQLSRVDENSKSSKEVEFSTRFAGMERRQENRGNPARTRDHTIAPTINQKTATSAVFLRHNKKENDSVNTQELNSIEIDLDRRNINKETKQENILMAVPNIKKQETTKNSPILGVLEKPKAPPLSIQDYYLFSQGKYFDIRTGKTVIFEDTGKKLVTAKEDIKTVHDMLEVAKSKGWDSIKLSGTPEFKRLVYIEAESQGIRTKGYSPKKEDIDMVNLRREERSLNEVAQSVAFTPQENLKSPDHKSLKTQAISDIDKMVKQHSTPSKAQINSSVEADTNFEVKPENIPGNSISSELSISASKLKSEINNQNLEEVKLNYENKSSELSPKNLNTLKNYEKNTMDVIQRMRPEFKETAQINFYESTIKFMNGQELNLPEPKKQELKHDLGISNDPKEELKIDISR